jgi:hypothetical protein
VKILLFSHESQCSGDIISQETNDETNSINLSVVACGDRVPETLVLLKSALMFTRRNLHFYVFTETPLKKQFSDQVNTTLFDISSVDLEF